MENAENGEDLNSDWAHLPGVVFGYEPRRHINSDWSGGRDPAVLEHLPQEREVRRKDQIRPQLRIHLHKMTDPNYQFY